MTRERSHTLRIAQWAMWAGLAMIAVSFLDIVLGNALGWNVMAPAVVIAMLWLSALSGLVVACVAAGIISIARRRARRKRAEG